MKLTVGVDAVKLTGVPSMNSNSSYLSSVPFVMFFGTKFTFSFERIFVKENK